MLNLSINLPRYRLDLHLVRRRGGLIEPLIPSLAELKRVRGSKISHFFRHIFEHKRFKKILGSNLALALFASTLVPGSLKAEDLTEPDRIPLSETIRITTERGIQLPVSKLAITQRFYLFHPGVDLDGKTGDPIKPIMSGLVKNIQRSRFAYGNAVIVDHGNNVTSLYAHLSKITVIQGQAVDTNTKLGEMGSTGRSFGDHLHLEIRDGDKPINPLSLLPH